MGTVPYMSPEQVQGRPLDLRTDIFSLGIILFEMATGQRPFHGESSAELVSSILRDTPPSVVELRADLPSELGRVIGRCLEKSVAERFPSAQELRYGLRGVPTGATPVRVAATPVSRPPAPVDSGAERAGTGAWVAVLPFKHVGDDADLAALADGLTEEIGTGLSRFRYLSVVSSASAARVKGEAGDERALGRQTRRALRARRKPPQGRHRHPRERPARRHRDGSPALGRDVQPGPRDVEHVRGPGRRCRPHRRHGRRQLRGARACVECCEPSEGRRPPYARGVAVRVFRLHRAVHARQTRGAQEQAGARDGTGRPAVGRVGLPRADLRRRIRVWFQRRRDRSRSGPGCGPPRGGAGSGEPVCAPRAGTGALLPPGPRRVRPRGRARDGLEPVEHPPARDVGTADRAHRRVRARRRDRARGDGVEPQPRGLDALRSALGALPEGGVRAGPRAREPGGRARRLLALSRDGVGLRSPRLARRGGVRGSGPAGDRPGFCGARPLERRGLALRERPHGPHSRRPAQGWAGDFG